MDTIKLPNVDLPWPKAKGKSRRGQKKAPAPRKDGDVDTARLATYGLGVLTGALTLKFIKKKICGIPVLGLIATPLMALVPCTLIGAAAGAAAVYTIEEGDISAVRRKLLPAVRRRVTHAHAEVKAVAADVRKDAEALARERDRAMKALQREGERLAPALEGVAAEALPVLRDYERGRRAIERGLLELERAGLADGVADGMHHGRRRGGGGGAGDFTHIRRFLGVGSDDE